MANGTLGFDFLAYHDAAVRVVHGQPLYDPTVQSAGGFGLFYYPATFLLAVLPFALVDGSTAVVIWFALSIAMLVAGIGLMPVRREVRWLTLLLAAVSWPTAYALKLGQVGPLLLLLFAVGWRWLDRPERLGAAGAIGAAVKLQPGLILAWAAVTGRWRAVAVGIVVLLVAAGIATVVAGGPVIWTDYIALVRNVSDPITTPHNFTPGAVAWQLGAPAGVATVVQLASSAAVVVLVILAALRLPAETSYLQAVVASQLLSPVLWDHYAMLLLLPVAFLLERRQWWALAVPIVTSVFALWLGQPPILYPASFWAVAIGLILAGRTGPASPSPASAPSFAE